MAAAAVGALISGVAMYAVGARASQNPFAEIPALVQTVDGQYVRIPGAQPVYPGYPMSFQGYSNALQPAAPVAVERVATRPRTVYRTVDAQDRVVVSERPARRSWKKSGLMIGGSAASGAGVGGILGGKKGALIGAALGGGAASIYEATKH
jgi:hypothetical protein